MKMIFLFLILFSFNSFAGYVAGSKINVCDRTDYIDTVLCQESEGEACYKVPEDSGECGIFKLKDIYGTTKFDEESCSGKTVCELLLTEKVCGVGRWPLIDAEYTEVYCVEVVGKEMVIDVAVKTQKDAQKAQAKALEDAIQIAQNLRQCGERVVALMLVRNQPKNLTTAQVKSLVATYSPIKELLESGSLVSAKEEINAVAADGLLVTNGDKAALTAEINKCLGL